ncbi:MAG: epoxyqueuosine reductase QueH [Chloroflexota bacterium]
MPELPGLKAQVVDARGQRLSPCPRDKAVALIQAGKATLLSDEPLTIRLVQVVEVVPRARPASTSLVGRRVLLHICCGPCATYVVAWLRAQGADVCGYWFNPNIHPYSEHERRRQALAHYAQQVGLPVAWEAGYALVDFLRAVVGHERLGERCALCYRLRLNQAARAAAQGGYDAFATTLLISPYQDQRLIHQIGDEAAAAHGTTFHFENYRSGFHEHGRLAEAHGLYRQRYCGCIYSEWEALDRDAPTGRRAAQPDDAARCPAVPG